MNMRPAALLLFGLLVLGAGRAWAQPADPACAMPPDEAESDTLPHVTSALRAGQLSVLAVGSGTLVEAVNGRADGGFVHRMADALRAAHPGLRLDLTVRGGKGMSADGQLDAIQAEIGHAGPRRFDLVIWQTGTVDAVRNQPPADFYDTLVDGAGAVQAAGADLVLVDPQFSHFLQANADLAPYEQAMEQAAALPAVILFHRFAAMRAWADAGQIDLERADEAQRPHLNDVLHGCLGANLARLILDAARDP